MKNKIKLMLPVLLFLTAVSACKNTPSAVDARETSGLQSSDSAPVAKLAKLEAPEMVDMGVFDKQHPAKTADVEISNIGEDTLYVRSVVPDCDCTKVLSVDSFIAPQAKGKIVVKVDLTKYPADTIYNIIHVLSNDPERRVFDVSLIGDRRR